MNNSLYEVLHIVLLLTHSIHNVVLNLNMFVHVFIAAWARMGFIRFFGGLDKVFFGVLREMMMIL